MMGLGKDQAGSGAHPGRVEFEIRGSLKNNTFGAFVQTTLFYGTGTAPSNGAAFTGTQVGNVLNGDSSVANGTLPFSSGGIVTGLTPGTAYWFDLDVTGVANTGSVINLSCSVMEF